MMNTIIHEIFLYNYSLCNFQMSSFNEKINHYIKRNQQVKKIQKMNIFQWKKDIPSPKYLN